MSNNKTTKIYQGKPCQKCGDTERYECDGKCIRCKKKYQKLHHKTPEGKATLKRFRQSDKGKLALQRHNASEKRKIYLKHYYTLDHVKKNQRYRHVKHTYGLSRADYDMLVKHSKGICEICSIFLKTPHVDHNHVTGKIRGLLCFSCNRLLGDCQDNIETLKSAIRYLDKNHHVGPLSSTSPKTPVS